MKPIRTQAIKLTRVRPLREQAAFANALNHKTIRGFFMYLNIVQERYGISDEEILNILTSKSRLEALMLVNKAFIRAYDKEPSLQDIDAMYSVIVYAAKQDNLI